MLYRPRAIWLRAPAAKATDPISAQRDKAAVFLNAEYSASTFPQLRRDLWRWPAENEALIDTIRELGDQGEAISPEGGEHTVDDDRVLFVWLQDEVAQDVAALSALLLRIRGAVDEGLPSANHPGSPTTPRRTTKVVARAEANRSEERLYVGSSQDDRSISTGNRGVLSAEPVDCSNQAVPEQWMGEPPR